MSIFCDFIQVFVFTTNHHLNNMTNSVACKMSSNSSEHDLGQNGCMTRHCNCVLQLVPMQTHLKVCGYTFMEKNSFFLPSHKGPLKEKNLLR